MTAFADVEVEKDRPAGVLLLQSPRNKKDKIERWVGVIKNDHPGIRSFIFL